MYGAHVIVAIVALAKEHGSVLNEGRHNSKRHEHKKCNDVEQNASPILPS